MKLIRLEVILSSVTAGNRETSLIYALGQKRKLPYVVIVKEIPKYRLACRQEL